jgi:hypothetical protein
VHARIHMQATPRLEIRFCLKRVDRSEFLSHPAATDIEHFPLDPLMGPGCERLPVGIR